MALMLVEKSQPFGHPRVEPAGRVFRDLANDVGTIPKPLQLAARRRWEDGDLAVLALITILRAQDLAIESETSLSVV